MNTNILNTNIQEYIDDHLNDDLKNIALKGINLEGVADHEILEQIQAKAKAKIKLPAWYSCKNIYYPPKTNLEQTSSAITGEYKASLVSGNSLIDLTGGFGVDSFYFSKKIKKVTHCEINSELSEIATHNFKTLEASIETKNVDGLSFLELNPNLQFDWIYLDPARRDEHNKKVFQLKETNPNILYHLKDLLTHTNNILLKTSPLLDLSLGIKHLEIVAEIHIIAIKNEVKELLWVIKKNHTSNIEIKTINIVGDFKSTFNFQYHKENENSAILIEPLRYLYEPNAAIMKSGGFAMLGKQYDLSKLHANSHLYSSDSLVDFPGRKFEIISITPYQKKLIKRKFGKQKHNVTTRNFTLKVSDIRHLFQISDGGESYLFFTTNMKGKKIVLECKKIR